MCHECRELAEALRPARDLLHESLLAVDRAGLPCYDPGSANEAVIASEGAAVNRIMEQVREATFAAPGSASADSRSSVVHGADAEEQPTRFAGFYPVISIAAALAAVLMVATVLPRYGGSGASAAPPKTGKEKWDYLAGLGVSEFCLETTVLVNLPNGPAAPHGNTTECCTDCHHASDCLLYTSDAADE